ncbi:hypothetical protein [Leptothrix discophora]|uniref:Uncharacterized protein n=1 Tax=Leptothrix discophora TaxID=89 RepID=A0ABT9FXX4_LEPDI|nr:hypothetical protein [Leptothrix discophora]MDP4299006.1 hypothetical protein [Leptothrix discophora]
MTHTPNARSPLLAAALSILAITAAQAAVMSPADYKDGKTRIASEYKTDRQHCKAMSGNAGDICVEQAKGREKVALAELELGRSGKSEDDVRLRVVRAETAYAISREKCDDLSGNGKAICVQEAKTVETKALADARMVKAVGEAREDSAQEVGAASYKLALEKCDALAGEAKETCITAARQRHGK